MIVSTRLHRRPTPIPRPPRGRDRLSPLALAAVLAAGVGAGCDGTPQPIDASAAPSARTSAVSLRIDVPAEEPATLTVLAFRAAFSGVSASDVLGLVDPLAGASPTRDCQMRDLDGAAAALVARGDGIELEEMIGVGVSVNDVAAAIRPTPRLFPDVAATIGGVVAEAGPLGLPNVPQHLRVTNGAAGEDGAPATLSIAVPATGWVSGINGAAPRSVSTVVTGDDLNLNLNVAAGAHDDTSIELRPFGSTVALVCRVPAEGQPAAYVIPRQLLSALVGAVGAAPSAPVAAALDLVRRADESFPQSDTRVSVEVRTSTLVELRP